MWRSICAEGLADKVAEGTLDRAVKDASLNFLWKRVPGHENGIVEESQAFQTIGEAGLFKNASFSQSYKEAMLSQIGILYSTEQNFLDFGDFAELAAIIAS